MKIVPEDDRFHPRNDDPYWNESGWFSILIPERNIEGWIYLYHRPNLSLSAGGVALWDSTGEHAYDCLYYQYDEHMPLPAGADMFNFTLDNSLSVYCQSLQQEYHLTYEGYGIALDLEWRAKLPPHGITPIVDGEVHPGFSDFGNCRYDQPGHMTGTITLNGEAIRVDSVSFRDHSWGPRRPKPRWPRGEYGWGSGSDVTFGIWTPSSLAPEEDPIVGVVDDVSPGLGFYIRDDKMGTLMTGTTEVERGEDGRPLRVLACQTDDLGRTLEAVGHMQNWFRWYGPLTHDIYVWWCLTRWEVDGEEVWGDFQDFMMLQAQRQVYRSLKGLTPAVGGNRS